MSRVARYPLFFFIFSLVLLFVGIFLYSKTLYAPSENNDVEIEIIEDSVKNDSFSKIIQKEIMEESLEQDAKQLIVSQEEEISEAADTGEDMGSKADLAALSVPTIERKNSNEIKIGFITDIHARSNSNENEERVLKQFFQDGINYFIEKMNNSFVPDFILANGDIIEGTGRDSDVGMKEISLIQKLFDRASISKYWVVGNHDLRSIDKKQWQEVLGIDYLNKSFEIGEYKIIILDSNFSKRDENVSPDVYYTRGRVSEKQIRWLKKELENTDKKTIVFMHHPPLWNTSVKSNNRFPDNTLRLQEIFSENNVLAVFGGHLEDLYVKKTDGVMYFILPGFVKNKKYQKTFSAITIEDGKIAVDMSYLADNGKYRTVRITD